jgi:hypothetical protein
MNFGSVFRGALTEANRWGGGGDFSLVGKEKGEGRLHGSSTI